MNSWVWSREYMLINCLLDLDGNCSRQGSIRAQHRTSWLGMAWHGRVCQMFMLVLRVDRICAQIAACAVSYACSHCWHPWLLLQDEKVTLITNEQAATILTPSDKQVRRLLAVTTLSWPEMCAQVAHPHDPSIPCTSSTFACACHPRNSTTHTPEHRNQCHDTVQGKTAISNCFDRQPVTAVCVVVFAGPCAQQAGPGTEQGSRGVPRLCAPGFQHPHNR